MKNQPAWPGIARSTCEGGEPVIEHTLIQRLAATLAAQLQPPPIPFEIDLWNVTTIAGLLKRSESHVRNRMVYLPDFPKAIRLPVTGGPRLYCAAEVLVWVGKPGQRLAGADFFTGLAALGAPAALARTREMGGCLRVYVDI